MIRETKRRLNCSHSDKTQTRLRRRLQELQFLYELTGCQLVEVRGSELLCRQSKHISQFDVLTVHYNNQQFNIKLGSSKYAQSIGGLEHPLPDPKLANFKTDATKQLSQIGIVSAHDSKYDRAVQC